MTESDNPQEIAADGKRLARRLKLTALIVLVSGVIGAGVVYWLGTSSADDSSMPVYSKAELRQREMYYGKAGLLLQTWMDDLKQPDTQAILILVTTGLVAGVCFHLGRSLDQSPG